MGEIIMNKTIVMAAVIGLLASAAQATTIGNLGSENSTIMSWGLPDTAAYGQTFTLGSSATVNDVTFRINDFGTAISYTLNIFAWGGNMTTGSALFSIAGLTNGVNGMTSVTTSAGNTLLGAGQYVAFLEAASSGSANWGSVGYTDSYAGGAFVFQNNGGDVSQYGTSDWSTDWQGAGSDLAFAINTDAAQPPAVPLPAGVSLLGGALAMLTSFARRRRS